MNDWQDFLKEVHKENEKNIEWSKQREREAYSECEGKDYCEIKR